MSNPFLFDDEIEPAATETAPNPFLLSGGDAEAEAETDNPFLTSEEAVNPFAFNDDAEPQTAAPTATAEKLADTHAVDKAMSFFGTTITEDDDAADVVPPVITATVPPPRPTPPHPSANHELISSVVDQLDQNSSHLLDRIPKTRTPSPVSMRDLHSPSPTPETANLLMSDVLESSAATTGNVLTDNPFANVDDEPIFPAAQQQQQQANQPKQPPRPAPPRPTAPSSQIEPAQADTEADLFDFGTNTAPRKPPPPKSNQDILSLFAAPKAAEPPKPDLMTSDIMLIGSVAPIPQANVAPAPVPVPAPVSAPVAVPAHVPTPAPTPAPVSAPARPAPPQRPAAPPQRPTPPVVPPVPKPPVIVQQAVAVETPVPAPAPPTETKVPSVPSMENIQKIESEQTAPAEAMTETVPIKINDEPLNGLHELDKSDTISDNSSAVDSSIRTPGVATPFYSPGPDAQYLDRGQTPVDSQLANTKEEMLNTYINEASAFDASTESNPFGSPENAVTPQIVQPPPSSNSNSNFQQNNDFDAFSAKFDSVKKDDGLLDGFGGSSGYKSPAPSDAWGDDFAAPGGGADASGFEAEDGFDSFLAMQAPPEDEVPKMGLNLVPPSRGSQGSSIYAEDELSDEHKMQRTGSQESPSTPLFDDDVSQPLEDFPRITYTGDGWDMYLRQPNKKKFTAQRFWKKIFLKITFQNDTPVIQMFNTAKDKEPFSELPLQGCYSVSDISAQPFDQFGKIFTIKLQYILYKERPGVRPGQVTKAGRITDKLSQFAAYAIQGDYQGVKEFGSDLRKLGLPVEHHPHVSELFKIGSHSYEDVKQISVLIEEQFFKFNIHRDRALTYKFEEVQVTGVDEFYAEQTYDGLITRQIARVRLFFLAFLNGMPTIELGVNDMWRQGKEVVGRHDIIPVATEEWIRLEGVEFHACVQQNEYERSRLIRFQPPDACYIELMRFRVRPPKNRELPLQVKAVWCVTGKKVELRVDVLVPGVTSRKHGQIPCEDVSIRFPIPECWIYLFRVEKHFRYGSVKSAHRRTGKIKGIERILGTVVDPTQIQESLIEVTSGQAKYEHHHRAIVWRCARLPKDGQGAYTTHQMVVRMALTSYDQIPDKLAEYCYVEYTMPQTVVSHTTIRSVSVQDSDSDDPPEKYVRYLSRYEYQVGIEYTQGQDQNPYLAATYVKKESPKEEKKVPAPLPEASESDSDSN